MSLKTLSYYKIQKNDKVFEVKNTFVFTFFWLNLLLHLQKHSNQLSLEKQESNLGSTSWYLPRSSQKNKEPWFILRCFVLSSQVETIANSQVKRNRHKCKLILSHSSIFEYLDHCESELWDVVCQPNWIIIRNWYQWGSNRWSVWFRTWIHRDWACYRWLVKST